MEQKAFTLPICGDCNVVMRCQKNGVMVNDSSAGGFPATYWSGDRYECPECKSRVIVGFGKGYSYDEDSAPDNSIQFRYG